MKSSYPLTDYETHIVRETPELAWDDATRCEAEALNRLPIDVPLMDDNGQEHEIETASDAVAPVVVWLVLGAAVVIIASLWGLA